MCYLITLDSYRPAMRSMVRSLLIVFLLVATGGTTIATAHGSTAVLQNTPPSVVPTTVPQSSYWMESGFDSEHTSRSPLLGPATAGILWRAPTDVPPRYVNPAPGLVQSPDGTIWFSGLDLTGISQAGAVVSKIPVPHTRSAPSRVATAGRQIKPRWLRQPGP